MLFRRPYCVKALWSDSYFQHRLANHSHQRLNFLFSSCRFLMTISLRLMISSLRELIRLINCIVLHALHLVLVIHDWLLLFSSCIITMDHILIKHTILTNHVQITHNEFSKQQCIFQVEFITFRQVWELYI